MILEQDNIPDLLRNYFPQLSERGLRDEIAQVGKVMTFSTGEMIMDFGSYIKMIPLVIQGSIKVSREGNEGEEIFLYYLQGGDACTMTFTCCMRDKQSAIRTIAEDDTRIIAIPTRYMDEWMMKYPTWKNFVMTAYDHRMLELIDTIDQIVFKKLDERLLDYLRKRAQAVGQNTINTTHQEIADDLNVTRESISRLLKTLEKQKMVELGRNMITLRRL
ncbi:MAG: Crp/Fnr family transcriptional regulator [Saprospiraceae bacterium]